MTVGREWQQLMPMVIAKPRTPPPYTADRGVYSSSEKHYGGGTAVGTLAVCCERGDFSHAAFILSYVCRAHSTLKGWLWRQQVWDYLHFSGRSRMAASRVHPSMVCDLVGQSRAA